MTYNRYCCAVLLLISLAACSQRKKEPSQTLQQAQLPGYDLRNPRIFKLPAVLDEISGISFHNGNAATIYAQQDEEGRLFSFALGDDRITETRFARKGDYEDVQVSNEQVIMLRSDGVLYTFPLSEAKNTEAGRVKEFALLPDGEYEGLYADRADNKLYVLCKHCGGKKSKTATGYSLSLAANGELTQTGSFTIRTEDIAARAGEKKLRFEPSALAKNGSTGEWFILSSVNKMLVITDDLWTVKEVHRLDAALFNQPEGIAFDAAGNLYISNERGGAPAATILMIARSK